MGLEGVRYVVSYLFVETVRLPFLASARGFLDRVLLLLSLRASLCRWVVQLLQVVHGKFTHLFRVAGGKITIVNILEEEQSLWNIVYSSLNSHKSNTQVNCCSSFQHNRCIYLLRYNSL